MSEINSFSDYASKYNTNMDYSYLFGGVSTAGTGSAFSLSDYAATINKVSVRRNKNENY